MARDAAKLFRELVASGEEIPYDVQEPGAGSPLPRYVPLTARFVREYAPALRELDSFGAGCAAIESAKLAGPYLAENGVQAPGDAGKRAELAGVVFLARLWRDSTDFSLDEGRLRDAISELQAGSDATEGEIEVVVPLRGLRMQGTRVELATATIVRGDTVDVPGEARTPDAGGGAGWEPTFLAVTRVHADSEPDAEGDERPDAGTRSVEAFRSLITALRLFKQGGVALGPHAWTRAGGGRWRRISTGAGRPRPGGYRLTEAELPTLAAFSRAIAPRLAGAHTHTRGASGLDRSIARFEAGLERNAAMEALNDYLLSLRFLLEGGGPAQLGLSMRVASLCAEPDGRTEVKFVIDRALALERELWSGEPASGRDAPAPTETAIAVEDLARAILKDAACGHLGNDLRATADEILLADGLAVGDGAASQRGGTAEWGPADDAEIDEAETGEETQVLATEPLITETQTEEEPVSQRPDFIQPSFDESPLEGAAAPDSDGPRYGRDAPVVPREIWLEDDDMNFEPDVDVIRQPERIRIARSAPDEGRTTGPSDFDSATRDRPLAEGESPVLRLLELHSAEREATQARVANLFPAPETTDWEIREVAYDRTRRAPNTTDGAS